ncbi:histidine phosphatase family protein [Butyrivibrio sp. AC2005]|uniref:histidine phosphatase family protein n=1 Tax=Butyrivibrio sp. AC2005 TaxID=1280672 RepID=UPI0003FBAEFF|nr:histidine phosphatase family protein [Butyrivibrio sp. AC2005]
MKIYILRHGTTEWNNKRLIQGQTDIPLDEFGILMAKETGKGLNKKGIKFDRVYSSPLSRAYETAKIILESYTLENTIPSIITDDRLKELSFGFMDGGNVMEMQEDMHCPFRYFKSAPDKYEEEVIAWRKKNLNSPKSFSAVDSDSPELLSHMSSSAPELLSHVDSGTPKPIGHVDSNAPELLSELCKRAGDFMNQVIEPLALSAENSCTNILISVHGALSKALLMYIRGESDLAKFWGDGLLPNCGMAIVDLSFMDDAPIYNILEESIVFYDDSIKNMAPKLL